MLIVYGFVGFFYSIGTSSRDSQTLWSNWWCEWCHTYGWHCTLCFFPRRAGISSIAHTSYVIWNTNHCPRLSCHKQICEFLDPLVEAILKIISLCKNLYLLISLPWCLEDGFNSRSLMVFKEWSFLDIILIHWWKISHF